MCVRLVCDLRVTTCLIPAADTFISEDLQECRGDARVLLPLAPSQGTLHLHPRLGHVEGRAEHCGDDASTGARERLGEPVDAEGDVGDEGIRGGECGREQLRERVRGRRRRRDHAQMRGEVSGGRCRLEDLLTGRGEEEDVAGNGGRECHHHKPEEQLAPTRRARTAPFLRGR